MQSTHTLLTYPAEGVKATPHEYTEEQSAQIDALRKYAESIMLPPSDPYYIWERRWLQAPRTIARYMRAAKWRFEEAQKRISGTLEWRREYKPDLIPPEEVRIESETGKIVLNGFDCDGRPILWMRPGRENTQTSPRQLRHLVFCLERARDMLPENQDTVAIIVDYKTTTLRTNPSIGTARKVLTILQQHYVETLGRAIVVNLPMLLNFFYKGLSPFMDPITRNKIRFNPNLSELIPATHLDSDFGGENCYEFEPVSYWQQIIDRCHIAADGTRTNWPEVEENTSESSGNQDSSTHVSSSSSASTASFSLVAVSTNESSVESEPKPAN